MKKKQKQTKWYEYCNPIFMVGFLITFLVLLPIGLIAMTIGHGMKLTKKLFYNTK